MTHYREILSPLAVVGADGKMGNFLSRTLRAKGVEILAIEKETSSVQRAEVLRKAQVVVISVPISVTVEVVEGLIPLLNSDALLVDLTSLKELPLAAMRLHRGEVLGLHPMFAPNDNGFLGQTVAVCEERVGERAKGMLELLRECGAHLEFLSAQRHDQLMAVVQGLNHFHSIVFAHAFAALGVSVEETIAIASPIYRLRMQLMGRILAQSPELYADMEVFNPYVAPALKALHESSESFLSAILNGSRDECISFFKKAADNFGPYREQAHAESDKLLSQAFRQQSESIS